MGMISGAAWIAAAAALAQPGAPGIEKRNPPGVAAPEGSYSHVAVVPPGSRLLFLAGQVGNRPDGTLPATIEDQAVQALENVRRILAAEGAGPQHIVKLTIYAAAPIKDWAKVGAKHGAVFAGTAPPPSTVVYVSALARPEFLIEVVAVAAVPVK